MRFNPTLVKIYKTLIDTKYALLIDVKNKF